MAHVKISKEQIIAVALKKFLQDGYDTTTLRCIASKLGISHGSIFNYFENKCEIGLYITEVFFSSWHEASDNLCSNNGRSVPLDKFSFLAVLYFKFMDRQHQFARFLCDFLSSHHMEFLKRSQYLLVDYVKSLVGTYHQDRVKAQMDFFLLDTASTQLNRLFIDGKVDIHEACIYLIKLVNYLWSLNQTEQMVIDSVERTFSDETSLDIGVKYIESKVFQSNNAI